MRIAEIEGHLAEYRALEETIHSMVNHRRFPDVFSVCEASFHHIEPVIKLRKKRNLEPITPPIAAFMVICRYAPALFEHGVIESFSAFIGSSRFWSKHENNYRQVAEMTLECEGVARKLWNMLESKTEILQHNIYEQCDGDKGMIDTVIDVWKYLGVITLKSSGEGHVIRLYTRLNAVIEGVCLACGIRGQGEKEAFLRCIKCGQCGATGRYHLTGIEMA